MKRKHSETYLWINGATRGAVLSLLACIATGISAQAQTPQPASQRELSPAPHARAVQSYTPHVTPDGRIFNAQGMISGHVTPDGKVTDRHDLPVGIVRNPQPGQPLSWKNRARVLDGSGYELAHMNSKGLVSNERRQRLGFIDPSGRVTDRHGYPVGYVPSDHRAYGMLFLLRGHGLDLP
ncbi:hypothetical protein [Oecophyllibacter saccharovorans]|uniref:hypothetical protein n=1 Tax=Oecophyllibacter saccharovorans TaxID=2558360 RepID=UPI001174429D|nr:hypothetical protein [Oecophyllibacter saccharovorans]TPW35247.1 hypothetical protein E3203_07265 [Oecophyllibacter saccharovorans]